MQRKFVISSAVAVVVFALFLTAIFISLRTFNREGDRRQQALVANATMEIVDEISAISVITDAYYNQRDPKVILLFKVTSIDLANLLLKMTITAVPIGQEYKATRLENASTKNLTLVIADKILKIKANENIAPIEATFGIDGDINRYPFDAYYKYISPFLYNSNDIDEYIPVGMVVYGGFQGLRLTVAADISKEDGSISLEMYLERSRLTLAFSLFIITMMWVISVLVLVLSLVTWIKDIQMTAPLLAVPIGCIFALPSIRNSQPMVPPVGTLGDIIGFFWNMLLVAISVIIFFAVFTVQGIKAKAAQNKQREQQASTGALLNPIQPK